MMALSARVIAKRANNAAELETQRRTDLGGDNHVAELGQFRGALDNSRPHLQKSVPWACCCSYLMENSLPTCTCGLWAICHLHFHALAC